MLSAGSVLSVWHVITQNTWNSIGNSSTCFFLLPYMYQIFGTQAIQTAHYILHAHIVLFIACVCMHMRAFFFHSNQEDRAIIMFKPHLYFECERMSTEKKLKLCRKKNKNKTALFVLHTKAHTQSLLSSCKRTKTVNFHVTFLIS